MVKMLENEAYYTAHDDELNKKEKVKYEHDKTTAE
jgi:hypothetical protein